VVWSIVALQLDCWLLMLVCCVLPLGKSMAAKMRASVCSEKDERWFSRVAVGETDCAEKCCKAKQQWRMAECSDQRIQRRQEEVVFNLREERRHVLRGPFTLSPKASD